MPSERTINRMGRMTLIAMAGLVIYVAGERLFIAARGLWVWLLKD